MEHPVASFYDESVVAFIGVTRIQKCSEKAVLIRQAWRIRLLNSTLFGTIELFMIEEAINLKETHMFLIFFFQLGWLVFRSRIVTQEDVLLFWWKHIPEYTYVSKTSSYHRRGNQPSWSISRYEEWGVIVVPFGANWWLVDFVLTKTYMFILTRNKMTAFYATLYFMQLVDNGNAPRWCLK